MFYNFCIYVFNTSGKFFLNYIFNNNIASNCISFYSHMSFYNRKNLIKSSVIVQYYQF